MGPLLEGIVLVQCTSSFLTLLCDTNRTKETRLALIGNTDLIISIINVDMKDEGSNTAEVKIIRGQWADFCLMGFRE